MRVIAGEFGGRKLVTPKGGATRPTSDRVRESIFNILVGGRHHVDFGGALVLDVFAGSGALGLEALSRGAAFGVFVERAACARQCIQENARRFGIEEKVRVIGQDARRLSNPTAELDGGADIAFLDPPYGQRLISYGLPRLIAKQWISPKAMIVVEAEKAATVAGLECVVLLDQRDFGDTRVSFMRPR